MASIRDPDRLRPVARRAPARALISLICGLALGSGCKLLHADDAQNAEELGGPNVAGVVTSLADRRFSKENARMGLWRPRESELASPPGVYFLEPYDRAKVPVLFIHGIQGSPADFVHLVDSLDRSRFQPWMFSYASGDELRAAEERLEQAMRQLEHRYHFGRYAVVGHSVGGLVGRGFILRQTRAGSAAHVPLFVTISTPWAGHAAAQIAVRYAPSVPDAWRDIAPGSEYLQALFSSPLPAETQHYLLFTFKRKRISFGHSSDRTVTLASQLSAPAQSEAARLIGYDDTHSGVLADDAVASQIGELLASAFPRDSWSAAIP